MKKLNRRSFLKRCGLMPFIGSLVVVAKAGDAAGNLKEDNRKYWQEQFEIKKAYFQGYFEGRKAPPLRGIGEFIGDETPLKILNGQVFEAPYPLCHTVIVLYFYGDKNYDRWVLLADPNRSGQHEGTTMNVCHYERKDGSFNPFYTQLELQEKLENWKLVKSRLILDRSRNETA